MTVLSSPGLAAFNGADAHDARARLLTLTAAPRWAEELVSDRPYPSLQALLDRSDELLATADEGQIDAALAGHPRIGERAHADRSDHSRSDDAHLDDAHLNDAHLDDAHLDDAAAARSAREQVGMDSADAAQKEALAEANAAYEARFGRIYLVAAAGLSAADLLAKARSRLDNEPGPELQVVRAELATITRRRLTEWLA